MMDIRLSIIGAAIGAMLCVLSSCLPHTPVLSERDETDDREMFQRSAAQEVYAYVLDRQMAVKRYAARLTMEEKAGQLFMVNINGNDGFRPLEKVLPGGYIFFRYNIADSAQGVKDFTLSIRKWCEAHDAIPPYLAVDEEGGDVERLRGVAARLPSQRRVAQTMTIGQSAALYDKVAGQMHSMGFHLNLAPVAEGENERNRAVLDSRVYGGVEEASEYGKVCVAAYQAHGVAAAIKHFPGNALQDPHTGRSEAVISDEALGKEISPFMSLIHCGAECVVMSHARINGYPPSCLSPHWVGMLRNAGFGGLIISDDIFMTALEDGYTHEEAAVMAVEAGVDVIMLTDKFFGAPLRAITARAQEDAAFASLVDDALYKVLLFKLHHGILTMTDIK